MYQLRRERGLTQRQVAEAVGIRQSAYAMIESGHRHPRKAIEKKLADFFGVTVDELFFAHNNHSPRLSQDENNVPGDDEQAKKRGKLLGG